MHADSAVSDCLCELGAGCPGAEGLAFACFTSNLCPQHSQELCQGAPGCQCGFLESAEGMSRSARVALSSSETSLFCFTSHFVPLLWAVGALSRCSKESRVCGYCNIQKTISKALIPCVRHSHCSSSMLHLWCMKLGFSALPSLSPSPKSLTEPPRCGSV